MHDLPQDGKTIRDVICSHVGRKLVVFYDLMEKVGSRADVAALRQIETVVSKINKLGKVDFSEFWNLNRRMKDTKTGVRTAITDSDV